jgi:protocatechuate 3,4-dioxygenase beta subunit
MVWHTVINDVSEDGVGDKAVNKTYKCVEMDSVCVAAGTYNVFVINSTTEEGNATSYYSPEVRNMVKEILYDENGSLTSEVDLVSYSIGVTPTRSVSGRVKDKDDNPVAGAAVTAHYASNNTEAGNALTNATGEYTISDLPADTYNVSASKSGYASSYQTIDLTASYASNIDFTLNATPTAGIITGHVYISGTTTGIQDANVSINASCYAITGAGGFYTLSNVAPGTHTVTASAVDYAPLSTVVNVIAGQTSFCNFTLTLLSETGNISGVVKDENNNTISGVTVTTGTYSNTTDNNGHYTITGVPAGTYNVTASKTGYMSSTQTNISVIAKNTTELNFVLTVSAEQQRGSISGTIRDKNGAPVAFATVKAYYANDTVARETTTNSTGGYKLSNLLPGTYTVKVSKTGFQEYSMSVTVGANQTVTKNAELTTETAGGGEEGVEGGAGIADYWWVAVVIAVIIVVVLVVLRRRIPAGRRIPAPREEFTREEMPPVREEFAPEKPVGKRFCIKCGREISKTAGFCPYCGYRFKK